MSTSDMRANNYFFGVIAVLVSGCVCYEWHVQGCGIESLLGAVAMYGSMIGAIWYTIRQIIKERNQ